MSNQNNDPVYDMLEEFTNSYEAKIISDDEFEIHIRAPRKFYTLWLEKLNGLTVNTYEIEQLHE